MCGLQIDELTVSDPQITCVSDLHPQHINVLLAWALPEWEPDFLRELGGRPQLCVFSVCCNVRFFCLQHSNALLIDYMMSVM